MNLTNLIIWCASIIIGLACIHRVDDIHRTILRTQARLIYESRTANWGTPKLLEVESSLKKVEPKKIQQRQ